MNHSSVNQVNHYREFVRNLQENYSLSLHMAGIFAATVLCAVVINSWLCFFSVNNMSVRYPLTVVLSYLCFLTFTRIWANIMSEVEMLGSAGRLPSRYAGALLVAGFMSAQTNQQAEATMYRNQAANLHAQPDAGVVGDVADTALNIGEIFSGLDEGALFLLVIAFFGLLAAVCGGSVVYYGSETLPEVLFQYGLAQKNPPVLHPESWVWPAISHTWKAFLGMAVMGMLIGAVSLEACPTATQMSHVWEACTTPKQVRTTQHQVRAAESLNHSTSSKRPK